MVAPPFVLTEVFPLYDAEGDIFGLYWTEEDAEGSRHHYAEDACHDELSADPGDDAAPLDWGQEYWLELASAHRLPQALEFFEATLESLRFDPERLYVSGTQRRVTQVLRAELARIAQPKPIPSDPIAAILRPPRPSS